MDGVRRGSHQVDSAAIHIRFGVAADAKTKWSTASIRPERRRIVEQEIAWAADCVIGVGRLGHRWARVEVVVVVTGIAAAGRSGSSAHAAAVTVTAHGGPQWPGTLVVVAIAFVAGSETVRMAVAVAAPIGRRAGRAIVRARSVTGSAIVSTVAVEQAASAGEAALTHAACGCLTTLLEAASAATRSAAASTAISLGAAVTRLAAGGAVRNFTAVLTATCIAAAWVATAVTLRTDRSAAGGREHREREHDKRAFHDFPPKRPGSVAGRREESGAARAVRSIQLVSAA
jgi:hypothetical protein